MPTASQPTLVRVLATSREVAATVSQLAETAHVRALVHICAGALEDAVENARAATPEGGILAVVDGKSAALAALAAGADEAVEVHILTPELLELAARLASERRRSRREREELQLSMARTAKLAALGTVVAGVAHEVNNPATMISLNLEYLSRAFGALHGSIVELERNSHSLASAEERAAVDHTLSSLRAALGQGRAEQSVRDCQAGIRMIAEIVRDLRVLSHASAEAPPEIVDVRKLLDQTLRLTGIDLDGGIHVERDFPEEVPKLWLPRSRVLQIFANLVTNSAFAMRSTSRPLRKLRIVIRADDTTLMIAFTDNGAGIASDRLGRLFEPFFTTKGPEHGTGLGLYMSREIVRKLGGELTLDSVQGHGTTAMVFLPMALQSNSAPSSPPPRPRRPRLLVAHDDERQLLSLRSALSPCYDLVLAEGAVEALDLVASGTVVDALLCGRDSPSLDGEPLQRRMATLHPGLSRRTILLEEITQGAKLDLERLQTVLDAKLRDESRRLD